MIVSTDDILAVRTPFVTFHVLRDASGLYLIDTGFIGGKSALRRALRQRGWEGEPIRGIILSHGHIDHILNAGAIARDNDAWIAAPRLDAAHYQGQAIYHGWARVTGVLEALSRSILPFAPFVPTRWLSDGDMLDVQGGLRAVHLPGHTAGHLGFYCGRRKLLFSADLFGSDFGRASLPPWVFNSIPNQIPDSVERALALDLAGVIPSHGDRASAVEHLRRLRVLQKKLRGSS